MAEETLLQPKTAALEASSETNPQLAPLTDGQESLYILSRLARNAAVYNMPFAFRLKGNLNAEAARKAVNLVVNRHSALRSNIIETDQGLRQATRANDTAFFEVHDLTSLPESEREEALQKELRDSAAHTFQLDRETAFRVDLFRLAENEHVILFTLHHAFGDIISTQILFREFSEAYAANVEGKAPAWTEVPVQMDQYARREASQPANPNVLKFWRERLATIPGDLELPADFPRPRIPTFKGAIHYLRLPKSFLLTVRSFARAHKCSAYMAFLTVLEVLIYRYTNQRQFAVATPFSSRRDPKLENTVGYLINLLPIACHVRPRATFNELLDEARQATFEIFDNESISLRRILQELKIPADSPKNFLNRVVFQYYPEAPGAFELPGIEAETMPMQTGTSKFDLSLTIVENAHGIELQIEYDADLFKPSFAERFGKHLVNVAESAFKNPDAPVAELSLLTASEKCFLAELNETKVAYPQEASIGQLFEEVASANPARIALSFEGTGVTYLELNRRADQIGRRLLHFGVKPGDFVGVCLERSPALVATLIGILKTGAAFVPFDAKYPEARLKYMFEDSGVRVLVAGAGQKAIAPPNVQVIAIEEMAAENSEEKIQFPTVSPDALAYMMYTSGSTGNPKGTTVPHRAVIRLVKNNDFARISAEEVFLLLAPVSFDASTLEIWGPLLNGGRLAIYPANFESLDQLEEVLEREKVTTLWLSSGLFNTVVDRKPEALRGVRQLLVGGDVVSPAHVQKVYTANPDLTIINGYGPTENTTFTCCFTIPRDWPVERALPIGRPIRNTQVYILDENLQAMPVGAAGELYCGGDGLSHGYWNKPDLTAKAFVPHPFVAGSRLYKTGDRVRLLDDGNIEFLGRLDSQIKIRGFRVELGEIETAFRQLPGVEDAAAAIENAPDGKRLLAFVITRSGQTLNTADMHEALRKALPEHACPSRIHFVEKFPLGPNGKVDKKALLELSAGQPSAPAPKESMNATEQAIARVWRKILDADALGLDENFFHRGGDSLRAMQAVLQINRFLNANVTISNIFETPTIRGLSRKIESATATAMPSIRKVKIEPRKREVAALSDAEVNAMLNQMLSKER